MTLEIEAATLAAMRAHAEEAYPDECCGAVLAGPAGQEVRRMTNVQNRLHAEDPARHPRDARTAYEPEPRELLQINRDGERPGWRLLVFYHSHPEHDAYFSDTDRARALFGEPGEEADPAYPGVTYVVLSVYDGAVKDVQAYAWREDARDFANVPLAPSR